MYTTTSAPFAEPLRGDTDPLEVLGADALSEVARSATLAQNLAGATRLEAAHHTVRTLERINQALDQDDPTAARRPAHTRLDPAAQARDHLCAALKVTTWHAARLVTAGVQIHTRLPRLRSAVQRGLLPEQLAIDTACRLAEVPRAILPAVESDVVASLARDLDGGHRPSRTALDTLVDTALERHDPHAAENAVADATEHRTVRFRPDRAGMTSMWARLPSAAAEKLRRRIDAAARAAQHAGHPRTRNQLRADALTALGDPTTDDIGSHTDTDTDTDTDTGSASTAAGRRAAARAWGTDQPIRISVIAAAARGLPNRVQFVTGAYASFDWLCQELLEGGDASIRFDVLDPQPGVLDKPDAVLKYFITPALADRIRQRDGHCRHPGCTVDAHDCDIDHAIAFDHLRPELGGPTAEWNLFCLCRTHHREKTFGHNAYRPGPLGELTIITDTGHEHRTTPTGPLAHARNHILDQQWQHHLDHRIAHDGHLTNPPGSTRRTRRR